MQDYLRRREEIVVRRGEKVRELDQIRAEIARADEAVADLDKAAIVFGIQPPKAPAPQPAVVAAAESPQEPVPQFKDVALDILKAAYPRTCKSVAVLAKGQEILNRTFHPKTAGMTLYRLAKDGLVERIGRSEWRYVPQEGESPEALASEPSMFP